MTKKEEAAAKREAKLQAEKERVAGMRAFERDAILEKFGVDFFPELAGTGENAGNLLICGIDEAGRGPLAGPVTAGVCILPADHDILYINDSKKLSAKKRDELYDVIRKEALAWNVGMVGPERIDEINILQATMEAMRKAIAGLKTPAQWEALGIDDALVISEYSFAGEPRDEGIEHVVPSCLIVDAVTIKNVNIPQVAVIKGDAKCASIAAASILAKVTRDRLMEEYDKQYPGYGFAGHKGYGTKVHTDAIRSIGPCPIHRRTFIGNFI